MADFELAVAKTILNEGGDKYTDHENDRGGPTKYGISLKFLKTLLRNFIPCTHSYLSPYLYPNADEETIKNLSLSDAKYIYLTFFWESNRYGEINDQAIAEKVFDMSVLMGATQANKIIQSCLGDNTDGIIGDKTLGSINDGGLFFDHECKSGFSPYTDAPIVLISYFIKYFISICNKDKIQSQFLLGWLNRVMS